MEKRYKVNQRKKYFLKKYYNFTCYKCGKKKDSNELEIDHKIPISCGGSNNYSNLIPLCIECHLDKTKDEWKKNIFGTKKINIDNFSPEEKLQLLKDFLNQHLDKDYLDIYFMVNNDMMLSSFNYNTTILSRMFNKIRGEEKETTSKWKDQRSILLQILSEIGLTQSEIEEKLKNKGIEMSQSQISRIINNKK